MSGSMVIDLIVFILSGLGVFFSLLRFLKGPSSFERLAAVDMMNVMFIGIITLLAFMSKNNMYMDIAIMYGLLAFIETIVFARYLEGKAKTTTKRQVEDSQAKSGEVK
ncbi:MAG TPA: cation:proton antiporter [Fervidobacterium sp.]|jgi:multicomponent Na+:H+ antiporter subunit F|nr:cation:proton antiporter [Fervidobacterium sp.]HOL04196.1 cation:proton antiporter [Fervidobacterium sp.]HON04519.1 cation:proton antiporter [Fervidobacterium sp.]HOP82986.1 cation:proton antiporter [Fervidobacterium sp.]HOS52563.1 cation:proton antiporter [Fervidobacterium sp.]